MQSCILKTYINLKRLCDFSKVLINKVYLYTSQNPQYNDSVHWLHQFMYNNFLASILLIKNLTIHINGLIYWVIYHC